MSRLSLFILRFCLITSSLALAQTASEPADELSREGEVLVQKGEFREALECYQQALSLYRYTSDHQHEAETYVTIGSIYRSLGKYEEALKHFEQAASIFQKIRNQKDEAITLVYIGNTHASWSRYEKALEMLQKACTCK